MKQCKSLINHRQAELKKATGVVTLGQDTNQPIMYTHPYKVVSGYDQEMP